MFMKRDSQDASAVTPVVDVVMAAFNAARFLPDTLASIQAQTIRDIRIIIVDDGSTDETPEILARAAAADARIQVLAQPNSGIVAATNAGLALSTAPFIARHDADDLSDPERLEHQLRFLETYPDCVAVAAAARHIDEEGRLLGTRTRLRPPEQADAFVIPAREPYLLHPFLMVRAETLRQVGSYRPLLAAEDSDLFWRLDAAGRLHNMEEVLGSYRMHSASISSRSIVHGRQMAFCAQIAAISAQRRAEGRSDLILDQAAYDAVRWAETLPALQTIGNQQLDGRERDWLSLAMSMKLIELCFYRPYEPTVADCRVIRDSLKRHHELMSAANAQVVRESLIGTTVRLLLKGMVWQALLLSWPRLGPVVLLRLLFRIGLPNGLRRRIKRLTGRINEATA